MSRKWKRETRNWHGLPNNVARALSPGERDNELQCRVSGGEADNFHVLQAKLAAGSENIVFCDVLLPFGIDDPESSRALHCLRDFRQDSEVFLRISSEKDALRIRSDFVCAQGLGDFPNFPHIFPLE